MSTPGIEADTAPLSAAEEVTPAGPTVRARAGKRFWRNRGAMIALLFLIALLLVALFQSVLVPFDPNGQDINHAYANPSWTHWLGTDDLGRDLLSRLIVGTGVAIRISVQVVLVALLIALPIGLMSGYVGGRTDNVLMRFMDAGLAFPPLILALAIAGVLGAGLDNAALAISIVLIPGFVRLVRASALAATQETYVEASRSIGTTSPRIVSRRILPNVASPLIVAVTLAFGGAIIAEAGLSFINLSVQSPDASWGNMLRRAYDNALFTHAWQLIIPGVAIALTVLAYNTLGDGLRDALSPAAIPEKQRRRRRARRGLTSVERPVERSPEPSPAVESGHSLLVVDGLTVEFDTDAGPARVVDDLHLEVRRGELLGLVGESGSGKTVTSLSILRLLPSPPGRIVDGVVGFEGRDLLSCDFEEMRSIRGAEIAMVFQDPMTSLNPAFTVGNQIAEAVRFHESASRDEARARAIELLTHVGIPDPDRRIDEFPHQLSGGMRQRVMLAIALACRPKLLIADEPTTALDVTIQAQILDLFRRLQAELGMAVIFVTHDLGVVADLCDRVVVMYAGQVVEEAPVWELFANPRHPYTAGLLRAMPQSGAWGEPLPVIPGRVPPPSAMPEGCHFHPRCEFAEDACRTAPIEFLSCGEEHRVRCRRHGELDLGKRS